MRMWKNGVPHPELVGTENGPASLGNSLAVPQVIKYTATIHKYTDPEILLLVIYPREMKAYTHEKPWTWMFSAALFTIDKRWRQQMSLNR
jgi:hypothetical protein